jgi:hypothetical protein
MQSRGHRKSTDQDDDKDEDSIFPGVGKYIPGVAAMQRSVTVDSAAEDAQNQEPSSVGRGLLQSLRGTIGSASDVLKRSLHMQSSAGSHELDHSYTSHIITSPPLDDSKHSGDEIDESDALPSHLPPLRSKYSTAEDDDEEDEGGIFATRIGSGSIVSAIVSHTSASSAASTTSANGSGAKNILESLFRRAPASHPSIHTTGRSSSISSSSSSAISSSSSSSSAISSCEDGSTSTSNSSAVIESDPPSSSEVKWLECFSGYNLYLHIYIYIHMHFYTYYIYL